MKNALLTALFLILFSCGARAGELEQPFMLAMDYSALTRLALDDSFKRTNAELNAEQTTVKENAPVSEMTSESIEKKWEVIKDFSPKPRSLTGKASFDANETVSVGAAAGYTFPEENEQTQTRTDSSYSVKINVEMAL